VEKGEGALSSSIRLFRYKQMNCHTAKKQNISLIKNWMANNQYNSLENMANINVNPA
jgi:hypothetical protein